jgi:hypothetical protein
MHMELQIWLNRYIYIYIYIYIYSNGFSSIMAISLIMVNFNKLFSSFLGACTIQRALISFYFHLLLPNILVKIAPINAVGHIYDVLSKIELST